MRIAILILALMVAACNDAGQWENEQAVLANEANGVDPAAVTNEPLAEETDYIIEPTPAQNEAGMAGNEAAPPPAAQE